MKALFLRNRGKTPLYSSISMIDISIEWIHEYV
jgi:hypothetical protein